MAYVEDLERLFRHRFEDTNSKKYEIAPEDFLMYLNEAQDQACVRGDLIFDRTSSFCTIPVTANTADYALNPLLYGISHGRLIDASGVAHKLTFTTLDDLDDDCPGWRDRDPAIPQWFLHYANTLELVVTPDQAFTLKLEGHRLGKRLVGPKSIPEIPLISHGVLVDWVLYRTYDRPDEDYSNPRKAAERLTEFERVFGPPRTVEDYRDRYQNRPHRNKASFI